ncbi:chemotaxis protein CheW [Polyangium jinanense]|uniref:Purine-binding chemotaxis protein CheW n=1 Tax=Polyangium jinanense TaxID=2829994 RepID=A0A9X4AXE1_9BACT|nr:chemotaxis protein CheW [Polyangium jinanense]MDC3962017.1 purine-binding chemotaxis protein CheW [Polyangium jinanense]MDC3987756.1 purine-binding chemotaxis protein CheW [Polyangium jinanense]
MGDVEQAGTSQYISFHVAGGEYAVRILGAREIIEYTDITRVPMMPPAILGVLNLRGHVVPVVDLAERFGMPASTITRRTCILVVETHIDGALTRVGILIDAVGDVLELQASEIEKAPPFGTKMRLDHLLGLGKVDGKLVLLLDIDHVLSPDELLAARSLEPAAAST